MSTLSLAHTLRQQLLHSKTPIQPTRRWLAEAVGLIPDPSNSKETVGPVDWRKRKVSVREDHGLWGFFRRRESENEEELKGEAKYMICETPSMETSGRGWKAEELRLKSFKDIHTLWYVLLRERNLLATQKEEARRMGVQDSQQVNGKKVYHVRKSMARIKQVLNERRLAYEKAYDIVSAEQETYHNEQVLIHLRSTRRRGSATRLLAQDATVQVQEKTAAEPIIEAPKASDMTVAKPVGGLSKEEERIIAPDVMAARVKEDTT